MNLPTINPKEEVTKITSFISDTLEKSTKKKVVIAVSGGIDSTTSLLLATQALGEENILPLHLPSKTTNPKNTQDALLAIKTANIPEKNTSNINIGSIIQKSWRVIGNYSGTDSHLPKGKSNKKSQNAAIAKQNKLRVANLSARIRMMMIFDHAKRNDALVVGTENYSEHLLGYFTRFGDEASDLEPIRHLYKTQVYHLARHLNAPRSIIDKAPSADLWIGQTDEKELGFSYTDADPILYLIDQDKTTQEIVDQGFAKELVENIQKMVEKNHFKHLVPHKIK